MLAHSAPSFPAAKAKNTVINNKLLGALRRRKRRSRFPQKVFVNKAAFLLALKGKAFLKV